MRNSLASRPLELGMRIRTVLSMLALLWLGAAGGAQAGEVARYDATLQATHWPDLGAVGRLVAGPVLAGDAVVWAQEAAAQTYVIRAATPGGGPRTVATLPLVGRPGADGMEHWLHLYGSATRLAWFEGIEAVEDGKYQYGRDVLQRIVAGPPGGPLTTVAGCDRTESCGAPPCFGTGAWGDAPWLALAGDALAVLDHCRADGTHLDVDQRTLRRIDVAASPATQTGATVSLSRDDHPAGAAGDLVAVRTYAGALRAVRTTDGQVVATYPDDPVATSYYGDYAMQADGKLAGPHGEYLFDGPQVAWRAPGDTTVHVLPQRLAAVDERTVAPAMAADRIALVGGPRATDRDLVVTDLAGHATPVVRVPAGSLARPQGQVRGLAFDGTRVAWVATQCEHTIVGLSTLTEPPTTIAPAVCASPRLVSRRALMARDGRFTISATCGRACRGRVQASFGPRAKVLKDYNFKGSEHPRRLTLRAPRAVRRRLAHGGVETASVAFSAPGGLSEQLVVRRISD